MPTNPTIAERIDQHLAAQGLAFFDDGYDPLFGLLDYHQPAPADMALFEVSFDDTVRTLVDPDVLDFVAATFARLPLRNAAVSPEVDPQRAPLLVTGQAITPAAWWKRKTLFGCIAGTKLSPGKTPKHYIEAACALPAVERKWTKQRREEAHTKFAGTSKACPVFLSTPEDWLLAELGTFLSQLTFGRTQGASGARMVSVSRNGFAVPAFDGSVTGQHFDLFAKGQDTIDELHELRRATASSWESSLRKPTRDQTQIRHNASSMLKTLTAASPSDFSMLRHKVLSATIEAPFDAAKEELTEHLSKDGTMPEGRITVEVDVSSLRPTMESLSRYAERFAHLPDNLASHFIAAGRAVYDPDGYYAAMSRLWAPENADVPMFS